mgnify:CR=1 FL=1
MTDGAKWIGSRRRGSESSLIATLVLLAALVGVVSSLGAPLVPRIAIDTGVSLTAAQWSLTITMLVGAMATPLLGRLGDGRHRRAAILATASTVGAGCVLGALPLGFAGLVVGRGLQGTAFGLVPMCVAVAREHLSAARTNLAVTFLSVTTIAGAGFGYPLSGLVATWGGVSAAYWCGALLCATVTALAWLVVPSATAGSRDMLDLCGALLLGLALVALLLGISHAPQWGWTSPRVLGLFALSGVATIWWLRHERRVPDPLVELRLLRHVSVLLANALALLVGVGIYLMMSTVAFVLQAPEDVPNGLGGSVLLASSAMVPFSVSALVVSLSPSGIINQWIMLPVGCVAFVAAAINFAVNRNSVWSIFLTMALCGIGAGGTFAAMPGLIVYSVPFDEVGSAIGFHQVLRTVGYSTGSALAGTVLAAWTPIGESYPLATAYNAVAVLGLMVFVLALVVSLLPRLGPSESAAK